MPAPLSMAPMAVVKEPSASGAGSHSAKAQVHMPEQVWVQAPGRVCKDTRDVMEVNYAEYVVVTSLAVDVSTVDAACIQVVPFYSRLGDAMKVDSRNDMLEAVVSLFDLLVEFQIQQGRWLDVVRVRILIRGTRCLPV